MLRSRSPTTLSKRLSRKASPSSFPSQMILLRWGSEYGDPINRPSNNVQVRSRALKGKAPPSPAGALTDLEIVETVLFGFVVERQLGLRSDLFQNAPKPLNLL